MTTHYVYTVAVPSRDDVATPSSAPKIIENIITDCNRLQRALTTGRSPAEIADMLGISIRSIQLGLTQLASHLTNSPAVGEIVLVDDSMEI